MSKSAIARGASMAADAWNRLDAKVQAKGGTEETLHILVKDEGDILLDAIADLLVKAELKTRNRCFTVMVDYSTSLAEMVAAGKYDYANENIVAKNFPISGTGTGTVEEEVILVHFKWFIESEDAIREMVEMSLEPAPIEDLLSFGAQYPDLQREFPIVCLGSSWVDPSGHRCVPCLGLWDRGRGLDLRWFEIGRRGSCRFLARRKRK